MLWLALTTLIAMAAPPSTTSSRHIVGGALSVDGAYPEVAALFEGDAYACTGVLVASSVILTAGHCGDALTHAFLDTTDLNDPGERVEVRSITLHPDHLDTYDLAIVRISPGADTPFVPIAFGCALDAVVDASPAFIAGFGAANRFGTQLDGQLRNATIDITDADCDNPTHGCNLDVLPGGELIAGGDGVDSCNGDSGGPLYVALGDQRFVAGIVSRAALPTNRPCGDGGIYTRLDPVIDWLRDETSLAFADPVCAPDAVPNRAPTLSADPLTLVQDTSADVSVTVDDADDDALTLVVSEPPQFGEAAVAGQVITYTPNPGYVGPDAFDLTVSDDGTPSLSAQATVLIAVQPAQEPDDTDDTDDTDPPDNDGCGCATGPTTPWWLLALPLTAVRRRSQSRA